MVINERTRCDAVVLVLRFVYCAQMRSKQVFSDGTDRLHGPIHSHAQREQQRHRDTEILVVLRFRHAHLIQKELRHPHYDGVPHNQISDSVEQVGPHQ